MHWALEMRSLCPAALEQTLLNYSTALLKFQLILRSRL